MVSTFCFYIHSRRWLWFADGFNGKYDAQYFPLSFLPMKTKHKKCNAYLKKKKPKNQNLPFSTSEIWEWSVPQSSTLPLVWNLPYLPREQLVKICYYSSGFGLEPFLFHKMCYWLRNILWSLFPIWVFLSNKLYVSAC